MAEGEAVDSIVMEEEIDPNYVPEEYEVVDYAKWLGMDLEKDADLFWIAREGLMAPLPKDWRPCRTKDKDEVYYFNFSSGESTWDHPCDGYYKRIYEEEKKKKEIKLKESSDEKRTKAKQDVEAILGKKDKKKSLSKSLSQSDELPKPIGAATIEKKPLPGISFSKKKVLPPTRQSAPEGLGLVHASNSNHAPVPIPVPTQVAQSKTATQPVHSHSHRYGDDDDNDSDNSDASSKQQGSSQPSRAGSRLGSALANGFEDERKSSRDSTPPSNDYKRGHGETSSVSQNQSNSSSVPSSSMNHTHHSQSSDANIIAELRLSLEKTEAALLRQSASSIEEIEQIKSTHRSEIERLKRGYDSDFSHFRTTLQSEMESAMKQQVEVELKTDGKLKDALSDLAAQLESEKVESDFLRRKVKNLQTDLEGLEEKLEKDERLRRKQALEWENKEEEFKVEITNLRRINSELTAVNQALVRESKEANSGSELSSALKSSAPQSQARGADADEALLAKIQSLKLETSTLNSELLNSQQELRLVRNELEDAKSSITRNKREHEALLQQLQDSQEQVMKLKTSAQRVQELQYIVDTERSTYQRLKSQFDSLNMEHQAILKNSLKTSLSDAPIVQSTNASLVSNNQESTDEIYRLKEKILNLQKAIDDINESHEIQSLDWKGKIENMSRCHANATEESENKVLEFQSKVRLLDHKMQLNQEEFLNMEKLLQQTKSRLSESQDRVNVLDEEVLSIKFKNKQDNIRYQELESNNVLLAKENTDLKENTKKLKIANEQIENDIFDYKKEIRELKGVISELESERSLKISVPATSNSENEVNFRNKLETSMIEIDSLKKRIREQEQIIKNSSVVAESRDARTDSNKNLLLDEKEEELNREQRKVKQLKSEIEALTNEASRSELLAASLRSKEISIKQLEQENIDDKEKYRVLYSENKELHQKIFASNRLNEELQQSLDEEKYSNTLKDRKVKGYQEEILQLQEKMLSDSMLSSSIKLTPPVDTSKTDKANANLEAAQNEILQKQHNIDELQRQIQKVRNKDNQTSKDLEEMTSELGNMRDNYSKLLKEKSELQRYVDDAEYNAKFLQQSVDDGKRRLANMESELFQLRKEKDDLQIGLRASTSELNQLKSQMSMISSERNSVSSNFDKTKQEIGQLRDEVRDLQLAKNSVEQVARSLRLELEDEKSRRYSLEASSEKWKRESATTSSTSVPSTISSYDLETSKRVEYLESQLKSKRESYAELETQYSILQRESTTLRIDCSKKEAERLELENQINILRKQLSWAEEEISHLKEDKYRVISSNPSTTSLLKEDGGQMNSLIAGQQMQILELQKHRNEIEKTVALQSSLVNQLEEKLRSSAGYLQSSKENSNNANRPKSFKSAHYTENIHYDSDDFTPPDSPVRGSRAKSANGGNSSRQKSSVTVSPSKKIKNSSSPPMQNKNQRLNSRYDNGVKKHRSLERQDVDWNHVVPDTDSDAVQESRASRDNRASANSVVSILRDVIKDLVSREVKSAESSRRKHGKQSTNHMHGLADWNENERMKMKLKKEQKFVQDIKKAIQVENEYVRQKQKSLQDQKDEWKRKKEQKLVSAEELHAEGNALNKKAEQVNALIRQVRKTQGWLSDRERKISKLQSIIQQSAVSEVENSDSSAFNSPVHRGGEQDSILGHLDQMHILESEMADDLTVLGLDFKHSDGEDVIAPHNHGLRQKSSMSRQYSDDGNNQYDNPQLTPTSSTGIAMERKNEKYVSRPVVEEYPLSSKQSSMKHAANPSVRKSWDSNTVTFSDRLTQSSNAVNTLLNDNCVSRKVSSTVSNSNGDQLRHLTSERMKSGEACADHVSWLDNLRREIGQFPYAASNAGSLPTTSYQKQSVMNEGGNVHGFSVRSTPYDDDFSLCEGAVSTSSVPVKGDSNAVASKYGFGHNEIFHI